MTTKWTFRHESGSVQESKPTDSRGLQLRAECGYTWVCTDSTIGWRRTDAVALELAWCEAVEGESTE